MDLERLQRNLEAKGFTYRYFPKAAQAGDYLANRFSGKTIGIGGTITLEQLDVYDRLAERNTVYWHWKNPEDPQIGAKSSAAPVYLSSLNGIAETGELINIDGTGNRVAATLYGKETVVFVVGVNKLAPDFDQALWRARNVAAPLNARRLGVKTPCAQGEEVKCYDCKSPERICRGLVVHWEKTKGVGECEVILVGEELGY